MDSLPPPSSPDEEVISIDLGRYVEALRKYAWVIASIVALSVTGAVIYTTRQTPIYEATASVKLQPRLPDLLGQNLDVAAGASAEYYKQQLTILKSFVLLEKTVKDNSLKDKLLSAREQAGLPDDDVLSLAAQRLDELVSVKYPDQNRIMYITVRNADKKLAKDIANAHAQAFVDYSKGLIDTSSQLGALKDEFDLADKALQDSEAALIKFQKDNDLLAMSLEDRQSMAAANINSFTTRLNDARAHRIELNARLQRMKGAHTDDVLDSPVLALSQSPALDTLKSNYFEERTKFAELEKEVGPKSTEYQMQKAKVDDLYASLEAEVRRQISALDEEYQASLATENALRNEVEAAQKAALELVPKIFAYNDLLRKKKTNEDKYNILVARLSTGEMAGHINNAIDANSVEILDHAREPTEPVSPKLRVNVLVAFVMSLFFGIALAVLLAFLDRSVKSPADAQASSGASVLGLIPILADSELAADDRARDLYVHTHPTSHVAEQCRSLRTNILFSAADAQLRTLVVSSANKGEGKTTSVIYLGTTMAQQSGKRVLLVDTDMRAPRLDKSLGVPNQKGLSNLIVGDENYDDVIKSTEIERLYVLPCGPRPPNPAELLMTKRFEHVLEELKSRFDYVILDSPPLQITDAVVLSKLTDGVLLVVRAGKTMRDHLKHSAKQIRNVSGKIIGVILNEFDMSESRYYGYYGYGYGKYGYGDKKGGKEEAKEASQTA